MGLYSTGYNPTLLRDRIGPEIESLDMLQLKAKMDEIDPADIKKESDKITADWEYPLGKPKDHVIEKAIRMYLASVQLCEEKKFDTFSFKCVDGVDLEMGLTHAVPSSLIADASPGVSIAVAPHVPHRWRPSPSGK